MTHRSRQPCSRRPRARKTLSRLAVLFLLAAATGCASLRYYAHVVHGQAALLAQREPIERAVDDPRLDPSVRDSLRGALAARRFASDRLDLPRNRSYASYVQLDRPFVTWSVFAAPEFAVEPITHCFPFAGCVGYLGFFDHARAEREAKKLVGEGYDTAVRGVAAYSTLGWFADPIVSSMLRGGDDELDRVIFHELAHQKLYLRDDTAFNESYASFVADEGLREWRAANGRVAADGGSDHDDDFTRLALDLRERLRTLYASPLDEAAMRRDKAAAIEAFRARLRDLREREWHGDHAYDAWLAAPINNASLVPFGLYDRWIDAFAALFSASDGDWSAFHARVRELARLPRSKREQRLDALGSAERGAHAR
ncbi:MAG TPA: aminopeptidase [Dokdonella sp.]|nr:aminopeptidase [Dokdonella sp.]